MTMFCFGKVKDTLASIPDVLDVMPNGKYEKYVPRGVQRIQKDAWSITGKALEKSIKSYQNFLKHSKH